MTSVLHPGMKLEYFALVEWPEPWIATAKEIVRSEFDKYVEQYAITLGVGHNSFHASIVKEC